MNYITSLSNQDIIQMADMEIYAVDHGLFYKEDEYETDSKYFYKYLMNVIVDKLIDE